MSKKNYKLNKERLGVYWRRVGERELALAKQTGEEVHLLKARGAFYRVSKTMNHPLLIKR